METQCIYLMLLTTKCQARWQSKAFTSHLFTALYFSFSLRVDLCRGYCFPHELITFRGWKSCQRLIKSDNSDNCNITWMKMMILPHLQKNYKKEPKEKMSFREGCVGSFVTRSHSAMIVAIRGSTGAPLRLQPCLLSKYPAMIRIAVICLLFTIKEISVISHLYQFSLKRWFTSPVDRMWISHDLFTCKEQELTMKNQSCGTLPQWLI